MDNDLEGAPRQGQLLDSILDASERGRRMLTYDEMAAQHGMIKSGVSSIINKLVEKNYLECERTPCGRIKTGSLKPTPIAFRWRNETSACREWVGELAEVFQIGTLPKLFKGVAGDDDVLTGTLDAGEESMEVPLQYVRPDVFMMEVTGESMNGDHLHTGDHVMVDQHARWHDGDMVAVRDQGVTRIKRIWDDISRIVLESSNPEVPPIVLEKGNEHLAGLTIHGKIIATMCSHIEPGRRSDRARTQ